MGRKPVRWQDLLEEALRPIRPAVRTEWMVSWREAGGVYHVRRSLTTFADEELDELVCRALEELVRRPEGGLAAARLLVKYGGG